ncbi:WD40 repeat-like protein [Vararia minispora EC-137]|uniref:WD40 repeat-like protein n=1 Tax=Vararia minispora EC-137 TaxID=1314806 RepID=A0ACB8QHQ3_9AGAM|nr:WD40 repeat-like protein [Vararia minispora EC-137]
MSTVTVPTPIHHIRAHAHPISALSISDDNERIYSADSSGHVVVTCSRSLRPHAAWEAHADSVLGVQEMQEQVFTHGRDNKIRIWRLPERSSSIQVGASATAPGLATPELIDSMDVNALNYCRFSLLSLGDDLWIAIPNLVESAYADIWRLPGKERVHAAIGKPEPFRSTSIDGRGDVVRNATGIIMSLHLLPPREQGCARLMAAYENGAVGLWEYDPDSNDGRATSIEGLGWSRVWEVQVHAESIMATAVAKSHSLALSVSADHLIGKYVLAVRLTSYLAPEPFRTKHPGNGAIALTDDARVCAVGGWDSKIRLYSTKSFKQLGTLSHHKDAIQALCFAHTPESSAPEDADEDQGVEGHILTPKEKAARSRWLVSSGRDGRVVIWELMDFSKGKR